MRNNKCIGPRSDLFGRVTGENGTPLNAATVMLLGNNGRSALTFARCKADGRFSVSVPQGKNVTMIMFSCIGYAKDTLAVNSFRQGQTVTLRQQEIAIREVKVKSNRINMHGDTLDYSIGAFRQKQDRSIADVIKKMPGMNVKEDGSIEYQGKPINKFYIEGMDLMGSKYSQASENLSADKVKKVQVYENHQPVKMLRESSFSDQAALNIVLKDDAKNVWQGVADIGMGVQMQKDNDFLSDDRIMGMLFSRTKQSISIYKFNNTGKDIMHEIGSRSIFEDVAPTESSLLSNISLGAPSLESQRTTFNNSHVVASNWLIKPNADTDLRFQFSGLLDKSNQQQRSETYYTNVADGTMITEDVKAHSYRSELNGELLYKVNANRTYLTNTLRGYADYDRSTGYSQLNGREVRENVKPRQRYVSDYLNMIRRLKSGHSISLKSYFSYNYLPGTLLLTDSTRQTLDMTSCYWGASTFFMHKWAGMNFTYTLSHEGSHQQLKTSNSLYDGTDKYTQCKTELSPSVNYRDNTFHFNIDMPVAWVARTFNSMSKSNITITPSASVGLQPNAYWDIMLFGSHTWSPSGIKNIIPSPIFTNYINMSQGTGKMDNTTSNMASLYVSYKDIINGFFATATASASNNRGTIMYEGSVVNGVYGSKATDKRSNSSGTTLSGRLAKSFRWARLNIGTSASLISSRYDMLLNSQITPFSLRSLSVSADFSLQPASWLSIEEKSQFSTSKQTNKDDDALSSPTLRYFEHYLKVFVMPGYWQVECSNDIYHSNDKSVSFCYFSDLAVSYRRKEYEIGITLNNIFGKTEYERRTITTDQRLYNITRLRPREIVAKVSFNF
jgi:hypothetical protein